MTHNDGPSHLDDNDVTSRWVFYHRLSRNAWNKTA